MWEAKEICLLGVVWIKKKNQSAFYLLKEQALCVSAHNFKFLLRDSTSGSPFKMGEK